MDVIRVLIDDIQNERIDQVEFLKEFTTTLLTLTTNDLIDVLGLVEDDEILFQIVINRLKNEPLSTDWDIASIISRHDSLVSTSNSILSFSYTPVATAPSDPSKSIDLIRVENRLKILETRIDYLEELLKLQTPNGIVFAVKGENLVLSYKGKEIFNFSV